MIALEPRALIHGDGVCAVPECRKPAGHNNLLCRPHWHRVPTTIRGDLVMAWHRYNRHRIEAGDVRVVQQLAIKAATQ